MGITGKPVALAARLCVGDRLVSRANNLGRCLSITAAEGGPGVEVIEDDDDAVDSGGREGTVGNGYSYNELEEVTNGVPMGG